MPSSKEQLLQTLNRVVNTLLEDDIPFAVAGGCAVYARGGPTSDHDVDIFLKPGDAARAQRALTRHGLRPAQPAEDWLTKVYDGDVLVDLIFRPGYRTVTDELLSHVDWLRIGPTAAPVLGATEILIDKLMVLDPHRLDFTRLLQIARELREQVDWRRVREETTVSPFARAFLGLLDDLGIGCPADDPVADETGNAMLPQYLVANLHRAFAEDPRTTELGVRVTVRGDAVVLGGEVASARQRRAVEDIVHEQAPKLRVRNDIHVTEAAAAPDGSERLS